MKVTKYPQSCLLIESEGRRLLIDPGAFVPGLYPVSALLPVDGILITHEHQDHVDPEFLKSLVAEKAVTVVGNASTQKVVGDLITKVVSDGESFEIGGFQIKAYELPHCLMVDGSAGPQNTGYVVDDVLFHPGDGTEIEGLSVDNIAAPVAGPDVSPKDVFNLIKSTGAKKVIPIHNDYFTANVEVVSSWIKQALAGVEFVELENGQSTEL